MVKALKFVFPSWVSGTRRNSKLLLCEAPKYPTPILSKPIATIFNIAADVAAAAVVAAANVLDAITAAIVATVAALAAIKRLSPNIRHQRR